MVDWDNIDMEVVGKVLFTIAIIIIIVGGIWSVNHYKEKTQFKEICESHPRLRYENKCTTNDDCIKQCVEKLQESS